jgi:hypothetical protein
MYLLTIRDGLHTRHIGPYESPKQAADQIDQWLEVCGQRAHWQIHVLESPSSLPGQSASSEGPPAVAA